MGTVYIDFDATISPIHYPAPPVEPPRKECMALLNALKAAGHRIVVWTARNNVRLWGQKEAEAKMAEVKEYLDQYRVPYDVISWEPKPVWDVLIDDRAIGLQGQERADWLEVLDLANTKRLLTIEDTLEAARA